MPKPRLTLSVRIPPYQPPRNRWRRRLHEAILQVQKRRKITYCADDQLELTARIYMGRCQRKFEVMWNRSRIVILGPDTLLKFQDFQSDDKTSREIHSRT